MFNPMTTAIAGWSEAVEVRARRLLSFELGSEGGRPVTMAAMLARNGIDPLATARHLMTVAPLVAQRELAAIVAGFSLDGQACPDPLGVARVALAHAGRAVTVDDLHPERRLLARLLAVLFRIDRRAS